MLDVTVRESMTRTAGKPPAWKTARLDAVADLLSGGTPSKSRADWWQGSVPWASPKDMKQLRLSDTLDHVTEEAARSGSRIVPAKTIFVVIRGMILAKALPVAMAEVPMAFNQDMKAIIARPVVDPEFLLYALASRREALALDIGTSAHGTRRLGSSSLEALEVPIPPESEQRAIAYLLSRIHARIVLHAKALAKLQTLKLATQTTLFREGVQGEPTRTTEVGEVPQSWNLVMLRDLLVEPLRNGYSGTPSGDGAGIRTLTLSAVTRNRFTKDHTKITIADEATVRDLWLRDGDILVERGNTRELVGLAALYRGPDDFAIFPDLVIRVRVNDQVILPDLLVSWLLLPWARRYFSDRCRGAATSMPKIDHRTLEEILVPVPPREEQVRIQRLFAALDAAIESGESRNRLLAEFFRGMLHMLITGKVRLSPRMIGRLSLRARELEPKPQGKVEENVVREVVRRIVEAVAPEQIILFGSAARGEMHKDSDLDFLVVKTGMTSRDATHAIRDRLRGMGVPIDIVVVSPEIVERYRDIVGHIVRPALREGRVVYAA